MNISNTTSSHHREGYKIIQVHPTLNCNLECIHCYSNSAPGLKTALDIDALRLFLSTAYDEGYNTVTVTGGEPFLYRHLRELLEYTKARGYYNTVITNGGLLHSTSNQEILSYIDLVTLSVDGKAKEHNRIRNSLRAFDQVLEAIQILKQYRKRFGIIHLLHNEPVETFRWMCDFAKEHGAKLLQLHPMKMSGRGVMNYDQMALTDDLKHKFFVLYHFFKQKHIDDFEMQLDMMHRNVIVQYPQLIYHYQYEDIADTNYYRELVIDEEGFVLPISHGVNRYLALGNIYEGLPLSYMIFRYKTEKLGILKGLYSKVYKNIIDNTADVIINHPELLLRESGQLVSDMIY